ncbi:hypothetical protein E1B28_005611 [Marasmius oreades]|uniref:Uncharacterized protein n=1 Tax=Marasmius oreades TaxID=181124 RepID=A0A9P7S3U2_9AGAR|nr:uncharacterized protein E1B28_005611 [Marasmius oreades]KAG7094797.1 hypothetical protein E1B28_005611 [Marasmius oreades]
MAGIDSKKLDDLIHQSMGELGSAVNNGLIKTLFRTILKNASEEILVQAKNKAILSLRKELENRKLPSDTSGSVQAGGSTGELSRGLKRKRNDNHEIIQKPAIEPIFGYSGTPADQILYIRKLTKAGPGTVIQTGQFFPATYKLGKWDYDSRVNSFEDWKKEEDIRTKAI